MRILWQPAQLDPGDWRAIDSRDWKSIEANPDGTRVGTGPGASCNAINVQGVGFDDADHYAVEHLGAGGVRVWSWWNDPSIYSPEEFRARVVEIGYLAPDPLLGGAWNTRQRETWYGQAGGEIEKRFHRNGPYSSVEFRSWSRFFVDLPRDLNVVHGIMLPDRLWVASQKIRSRRGWREWTDGVDPRVIDPETGKVCRRQAVLGLRAPKIGTRTRYLSSTNGSVDGHSLSRELTTLATPAAAGSLSMVVVKTTAETRDWGWNFGGNLDGGTHPNGLYQAQIDCIVNDGSFEYGIKTLNGVTGHFGIYNAIGGTHTATWEQTEGTHTGTGVKVCSRTLNPTDGDEFDSFQAILVIDHPAGHGGGDHTFTLELNEADDLIEGPWPALPTTVSLNRPAVSLLAQSPTAAPGAVSKSLSAATLALLAQAIEGDPGTQVAGLDAATLALLAQSPAAVPGAVSKSLSAATLALLAQEALAVPGSLAVGLDVADLVLLAQELGIVPGAISPGLDQAVLSLQAQAPTAVPGAISPVLDQAVLSLLAQAISGDPGGGAPQTVGLDAATLALLAQGIGWTNPFFVVLRRPVLALQGRSPATVPGAISRTLSAATLALLAQEALAGRLVGLQAATLALVPQGLGIVPGATSRTLGRPFLTISTRSIGYQAGATSRTLDSAVVALLAQAPTAAPGPISRGLAAATLSVLAQGPTASPGPLAVGLDVADLVLLAQELGVLAGGEIVTLDAATLSLVAQALSAAGFGEVVVLDRAAFAFYAFPVLTEGLIEQDLAITAEAARDVAFVLTAQIVPGFRGRVSRVASFESEVIE